MALWYYAPSNVLSYIGLVAFAIATIYFIYLTVKHKSYYFIPFVIGGVSEAAGYGARISSAGDPEALGPYIAQSLLLLLPPIFFAATIYMVLKKLILAEHAENYSMMKVRYLTKIFVTFDVISLWVQGSGGGMQAIAGDISKYGQWVVVVGLIIQLFAFGYYMIIAVRFQSRIRKASHDGTYTGRSHDIGAPLFDIKRLARAERILAALHITSVLIMIRSIYRLVEYIEGREGWLATHEAPFYVFDTLTMFLVMVMFAIVYPPTVLQKLESADVMLLQTPSSSHSPLPKESV
jgi:hypothetical protein